MVGKTGGWMDKPKAKCPLNFLKVGAYKLGYRFKPQVQQHSLLTMDPRKIDIRDYNLEKHHNMTIAGDQIGPDI